MAKKTNPWVAALNKKKAPVDLHPDVLRAVLRMNPDLRGGDRSTEEVSEDLIRGLPGQQPKAMQYSEGRLRNVLDEMLSEFDGELEGQFKAIDDKRKELERQADVLREEYLQRIIDFLAEVQPGPLSETARDVLGDHVELRRKIKADIKEINRRVRQASDSTDGR